MESEEEGRRVYEYLEHRYGGIQVCGMAKVSAQDRADDMLVNAINGAEVDCVLSLLSSPLREDFAVKNKNLFNVRLFLCLGKTMIPEEKRRFGSRKISQFLTKALFKKEIEKQKIRKS